MRPVRSAVSVFNASGLSSKVIAQLARETGFIKRAGGKIDAIDFIEHFCEESIRGTVSNNDMATTLQAATGVSVSRQACWERTDAECVVFFEAVLAAVIRSRLAPRAWKLCPMFKRILIQDSTIIQLPSKLFEIFSGVRNQMTTTCHARIQGVYDLCSGRFITFSIGSYSKNDLSVASDIPVEPGDLVLRDRGYFLLSTIAMHKANNVETISRYKHKTVFYDPTTFARIDLLELLSREGKVDRMVLAGEDKDVPIRLLAAPVPEEIANQRRMKAKKEMKGHSPGDEVLALLSWTIFLVSIENPAITLGEILALYGLRWRIENIFKTWKSHFHFAHLHQVSEDQLRVLLTARLIMISICFHAYVPLCRAIRSLSTQSLSLMKFMHYVCKTPRQLPTLLLPRLWNTPLLKAIARYCTYDKRKRRNFVDNIHALFTDLSNIVAP
jgi:hypothetical protein